VRSTVDDLRGKGLRVTSQRQAVLAVLAEKPHATAAELATVLADGSIAELSKQGLYNVLDDLTRVGLVRCIEPAGSATRYELRVGDNHHHVVCRSCGRMEDIDCAVGEAPCLEPARASGFVVDEAEVTWWGLCASCQKTAENVKPPAPGAPQDRSPNN
jgi:Fur family transcriptional regulator, stress-responsive regulator